MWVPHGLDFHLPCVRVARIHPLWRIIHHVSSLSGVLIRRPIFVSSHPLSQYRRLWQAYLNESIYLNFYPLQI